MSFEADALHAQAFVKARGDGLGFDLSKAEFHFEPDNSTASVWIDGQHQARCSSKASPLGAQLLHTWK